MEIFTLKKSLLYFSPIRGGHCDFFEKNKQLIVLAHQPNMNCWALMRNAVFVCSTDGIFGWTSMSSLLEVI